MTDRYEKLKEWAKGIPLDGSQDYHVLNGLERFEQYERHIAAEELETLINRKERS